MRRIFTGLCLVLCFSSIQVSAQDNKSILNMSREELIKKVLEMGQQMSKMEERISSLEKKSAVSDEVIKSNTPATGELAKRIDVLEKSKPSGSTFTASWKDGLSFASEDKAFNLKVGGRMQYEMGFYPGSDSEVEQYLAANKLGTMDDSAEFRRARLAVQGTIYKNIEFKTEYDFARQNNTVGFRDVYVGLINIPYIGGIRVGQIKEPFGMEELTPDIFTTFMERSLANTFSPSWNLGFLVYNTLFDQRMTWALGVFRDDDGTDSGFTKGDGKYNVTGRITGLPWYEEEGAKLLHLGAAVSHRDPNDPTKVRLRVRPESFMAPFFVGVDMTVNPNFVIDSMNMVGAETAFIYGPASLQGEYVRMFTDSSNPLLDDPELSGFYVFGSYFLTGEHRNYKITTAAFDRVKPFHNFMDGKGGWGAWEIAARYSQIDFSGVFGPTAKKLDDVTVGMNWYLNPSTKMQLNYVLADIDGIGDSNIIQMRFQIDF